MHVSLDPVSLKYIKLCEVIIIHCVVLLTYIIHVMIIAQNEETGNRAT